MKKLTLLTLVLALLCTCALAEDLGIQIIGGPSISAEPISLDDMKVGEKYTIDGYAKVEPVEYLVVDYFAQFNKDADFKAKGNGRRDNNYVFLAEGGAKGDYSDYYKQAAWQNSGLNADFLWLKMDVTNLKKSAVPFMEEISVKVVYADEYEFAGWTRQINYDHNTQCFRYGAEGLGGSVAVLNPDNEEAIDMMYTGTYVFGCTLPNSVIEDKQSPLRVEIKLGENELTFHIRK